MSGRGKPRSPVTSAVGTVRLGWPIGLALIIAGLSLYRSYGSRAVLDRWSHPFALVLFAACLLFAALLVGIWRARVAGPGSKVPRVNGAAAAELAFVVWGLAYFLAALDNPENGGRITNGNIFGSSAPAPALLEWVAATLLCIAAAQFLRPRLRGQFAKVALSIGTVALLLLVGEGILRLKVAIAPATQGFPTLSSMAWERRYVRLNHQGFRDVDHAPTTSADMRRLLVVGDSFAFGLGVRRTADRVGERVAAALQAKSGQRWEPINASSCDTNTLNHLQFLNRAMSYRPEVVILIYVFNDIEYLAPNMSGRLTDGGRLGRFHPFRLMFSNSYLFEEFYVRARLIYYGGHPIRGVDTYRDRSLVARHLDDLGRFHSIAARSGATMVVMPFDIAIVEKDELRERYTQFVAQLESRGIPTCSLEHVFDGFAYRDLAVNPLDGHPNARANGLAADAVTRHVLARLKG